MSLTGTPASACLRIETIWVSVKRDFFMEPPGWGNMPESSTYGVSAIWGSLRFHLLLLEHGKVPLVAGFGGLCLPRQFAQALADLHDGAPRGNGLALQGLHFALPRKRA